MVIVLYRYKKRKKKKKEEEERKKKRNEKGTRKKKKKEKNHKEQPFTAPKLKAMSRSRRHDSLSLDHSQTADQLNWLRVPC